MPNTKKLLSITDLKKYFPVAKNSIFQKEQLYVRANEEVTLDIYEGETVGIVGESGCGKSTLGRVLLQLYEQTAGSTMYYGRSLSEVAPKYYAETLKHAKKYIAKYKTAQAHADKLTAEVDELGDKATFYQHQNKNLAVASARSALMNVAKLLGGFMVVDNVNEGAEALLEKYKINVAVAKLRNERTEDTAMLEFCHSQKAQLKKDGKPTDKTDKRIAKLENNLKTIDKKISDYEEKYAVVKQQIASLKSKYADNAEFAKYEEMLDTGVDLARLKYSEMRLLRKDLQIIFQDPYSSLDPRMTIGQIIEEGLVTHKFFKHGSQKMQDYILQTMRDCGLQDYMLHRYPHQFSGGQRQRICIARALAVKPKFVVCDECVSALDVSIQSQIINLLKELQEREKFTYMFISHDLSVVRYISNRIAVMYLGNIVELAPSETIFKDPRHPYTVALLSSIPTTDPDDLDKERIILEGNIPSPIHPPAGCKFHTRCFMACEKCKCVPPPLVEVEEGHFVACHFLDKKLDENGKYLFELPKMEKKSSRLDVLKTDEE